MDEPYAFFRCVAKCMQLNALRSVNHNTSVNRDVIHGFQRVDQIRRHSFFFKGVHHSIPIPATTIFAKHIFAQVMIGRGDPKGQKILAIVDKTTILFLVIEVNLCCSFLKRETV
ncbi:hypothetical protein TNCV_3247361 [Trichonephila clavipes]|nr:hypothetical protein TNCV_3247361 [Trichonephila clavipes]